MLGRGRSNRRNARPILVLQGVFYALTGLWSLVSIGSFQKVTGPKTDTWLVKMVGALVLVSGVIMTVSGWKRRNVPEVDALAAGSALALMAVDWNYVAKGRISPVYLLDFIAEGALLGGVVSRWLGRR